MAPYSMDLRTRVLRDSDAGLPSKDTAAKYAVSRATLRPGDVVVLDNVAMHKQRRCKPRLNARARACGSSCPTVSTSIRLSWPLRS